MAGELAKHKRARGSLRGALTKLQNLLLTRDTMDEEEITTRIEALQHSYTKFQLLQQDIELHTEEDNVETEAESRYEIEELLIHIKMKLLSFKKNILTTSNDTHSKSITPKFTFQPLQEKETFDNYTKRLDTYLVLNNICDPKTKVLFLLSTLSPELHERLYDISSPQVPTTMTFEQLCQLLGEYLDPKPSIWASQHKFISRTQNEVETVNMYVSELKKLTTNCSFQCKHCNTSIADNFLALQFIRGLRDGDIRTKLLQDRHTTKFSELIQTATAMEMGKSENRDMTYTTTHNSENSINKIYNNLQMPNKKYNPRSSTMNTLITFTDLKGKCFRCGKEDHRANECSAIKNTCFKCKRTGHLARVCLQRKKNETHQLENSSGSDDSIGEIHIMSTEITDKYMITVNIESAQISMEFDTGATLSSISWKQYKGLKINKKLYKTEIKMKTYTGEMIKPKGVAYLKCSYGSQTFFGKLYIIDKDVDPIFGRSWMREIDVDLVDIHTVPIEHERQGLDKLFKDYETVFEPNLGKIPNYQVHLNIKEDTQPIFVKPRRVPYALKTKVDEEIDRLCAQGVLTKIEQSEWGTPIVPIVKLNGSIRLCADYKVTLNKYIKDEQYPIPIIEDIFTEMNGGELFCTLDISQAYLHMVMDEESALLQTLSTHKGTYKVNRLMFGVKVAPNIWQKFMDKTLQGLEGVKCFFDDIIVQGISEQQLLLRLRNVLQKLKDNNLRVNKDKCVFFQKSINYLGHTIDKNGLHKNKDKVKAVLKAEYPTNIGELRTFLGMANYYNKFIPNLASISAPLNDLLKQDKRYAWTAQCEESFNKIKKEISSEKVLTYFDPKKTLVLATDASPTGLGAVLSHRLPDKSERPIAFASRSLSDSEKKYSQIDKEATAIFWGLKKFFHYCYGRKFILVTDHKPLTSIFHPHKTLPAMSAMRLFHYAHFLSGFDYEIEFRKSISNANADYLSRLPVRSTHKAMDQHCAYQLQQIHTLNVDQENISKETRADPELYRILQNLQTGRTLRELGYEDNELTLQDDCILKGTRVMIPASLRDTVLDELHVGHVGIVKMKLLARSYVYWRGIDRNIEEKVKSCRACRLQQNEPQKVPTHHWEEPSGPWQRIHIDFAGPIEGIQLFIIVDAFSKWVEVMTTRTSTSTWCINKLKELFCNYGIPQMLVSDNGRQFTSNEFGRFLLEQGIIHRTSAPYHPATNGQAERFVQTIKRSLRSMADSSGTMNDKLLTIKSQLRRTPNSTGQSAYQLMFGRDVRTNLDVMFGVGHNRSREHKTTATAHLSKHFAPGDRVQVRSYSGRERWQFATVTERLGRLHYKVRTEDGEEWRRHVNQILPTTVTSGSLN